MRWRCDVDAGFGGEGAVEEVEGGFVGVGGHVGCVFGERPVDGFGAEGRVWEVLEEVGGRPGAVNGPFFHRGGQDERLIGPGFGIFCGCEVSESSDGVLSGDVASEGLQGGVSTLEGSVERV